ncbi:MAG: ABC transporter ATP-binding protein [Phycisphaeraceae bacterium]|nr:ABC transporter ATP-binding protein [Phycisphaeraceae bacterium]
MGPSNVPSPSGASSRARYRDYLLRRKRGDLSDGATVRDDPARAAAPARRDWTQPRGDPLLQRTNRSFRELFLAFLALLHGWWPTIAAALGALTLTAAVGVLMPLSTKVVIDYVITDRPGPDGLPLWLPRDRHALLWIIGGGLLTAGAFIAVLGTWGRYHMTRLTQLLRVRVKRRTFEHMARMPLHRLHHLKSGGVASILREDANSVSDLLFNLLYNPWRAVITFVGGLVFLTLLDWRMLVGGLILVPAVYFSHRTWIARIRPVHRAIKHTRTSTDAHATEAFGGMRIVRAFNRQKGESARFSRNNHLMSRQEMLAWWWMRSLEVAWVIIAPATTAAALVYGGSRVLAGDLTIGDVVAFTSYLFMLLGPMETLVGVAANLQTSLAGLDRILDVWAEPPELTPDDHLAPTTPTTDLDRAAVRGRIDLDHVWFRYPGANADVLTDICLSCPAGATIALVGASGSGKTTLCNLVARFFDPTQGRITLDGADLRSIRPESYRALLGIVEQDVFLFDGTVAENIAYADPNAPHHRIEAAARAANAHDFIAALERGYDTIIGERGVRLSGGQKQRIAIARALLAEPRILILDEATSNLDTESERLIQQALAGLMKGRTCFVIAHRLSTIRDADLIVVLEGGRIVESGRHDELLARAGRYRQMVEAQVHAARDYAQAK